MRSLAVSLSLLAALAGAALAESSPAAGDPGADQVVAAYAPFKAVGVMLGSGQALLWDDRDAQFRVVRLGEVVHGWKVVAIETKRVVVVNGSERDELTLEPAPHAIQLATPAEGAASAKCPKKVPVTVVTADEPRDGAADKPADEPAEKPADRPAEKPAEKPADRLAPPLEERRTISRAELDRELGDFDRLLATVDVRAVDGGGFALARVDQGSWVWNMGMRTGDQVRTVAGEVVSTVEDAARVYARLRVVKKFDIELDRGGRRVVLHYDVKR